MEPSSACSRFRMMLRVNLTRFVALIFSFHLFEERAGGRPIMTIDERLERLTEGHETLTRTVELMIAENRKLLQNRGIWTIAGLLDPAGDERRDDPPPNCAADTGYAFGAG